MKKSIVITASLCLLPLLLTACGGDSFASESANNKTAPAISNDQTERENGATKPATNDISLDTAFSQTLSCRAGVKPYFDAGTESDWVVSFDGDTLSITGNGQSFGGSMLASGNPVKRIDTSDTARLETTIGASGGLIWFERNATGEIVSAGHSKRTDSREVNCGSASVNEWLAAPDTTPFSKVADSLIWSTSGNTDMNCVSSANATVRPARLQLIADAGLTVSAVDNNEVLLQLATSEDEARDTSFVYETALNGGLRVWHSQAKTDTGDLIEGKFRYDFKLLELRRQAGKQQTRCVPAPLTPAAF